MASEGDHLSSPSMGPVLIVGATGYIGRFVAEASLASGCTTYALLRPGVLSSSKVAAVDSLREQGAIFIEGSAEDKEFIEKKLKEFNIEVVISVIGGNDILHQLSLVEAVKDAGTVKRFLPSEFGHDVDNVKPVEPGLTLYKEKKMVRRAVEAAGVPYTYICCNSIAAWPYHINTHPSEATPPLDHFLIYGDGNVRAYFVTGSDIGKFTIRAAYDIRTLNKTVHFRPTCNFLNLNEMASLWESKIGRTLPKITMTEEDLLATAEENNIPSSIVAALTHDIFINGCQLNFSSEGSKEVEISCLYPDISFQTVDECFNDHLAKISFKQGIEKKPTTSQVDNC